RGGYLAIFLMLSTSFGVIGHLLWHDAQWKKLKTLKLLWLGVLIGTVGILIAAIAASPSLQHRIGSIFAMRQDSSNAYRMNVYQSAFQMVKENPVVGIGPGNGTFKLVYGLYMVPGYNALGAYSVPLEIAVEQGVIGLSIFLLLLVTLLIRTLLLIDSERSTEEKLIVFLLFIGILGSFVYGFFDTIWYRPAVNLMFWFYVASLANATEPITIKSIRLKQGLV
ncbi:MAG: O-antigen ligase family protein, partial [Cyanobacteria bacterium]|nr:O-antigen ligase family protein [Cyanobacteriota bacterium]